MRRREEASSRYCRALDRIDPVVVDIFLTTLGIVDEDEFYRPFLRGEDKSDLVRLVVCGNKPHVPRWDPDEGRHIVMAANCGRVPRCVLPAREEKDHK